jgi:hypothetical protein
LQLRLLTLAPSTSHPPMIGDAKRIYRLARGFWQNGVENCYVGRSFVQNSDEDIQFPPERQLPEVNRTWNGIKAWLLRKHYNETKHCTKNWKAFATSVLPENSFNAVYCHFLFTYPLLADWLSKKVFVIDTHNSEWGWYRSFRESSRNPLIKQVCDFSTRRATAIMHMLPSTAIMAHVSQSDCDEYVAIRPDIAHVVVPNGGDIQLRESIPDYTVPRKQLLFFGSLHGKMSFDALKCFEQQFWPELQDVSQLLVAGANPSQAIQTMAARNGWKLQANLTEAQVDTIFNESHFSIMPFSYGAGSKLKFFDACARGVPILSTNAGACGQEQVPNFVTIADEPQRWRHEIIQRTAMEPDWIDEVYRFGKVFTWKSIASNIIPLLEQRIQ